MRNGALRGCGIFVGDEKRKTAKRRGRQAGQSTGIHERKKDDDHHDDQPAKPW
jgi:hypothetical protein